MFTLKAIINIETAESSPSYASALISQATANKSTMLIFLWSEPHSGKGNARIVGTYDSLIHGLYVNPATYRETMTVLAFSESYYGRMVVQMKSDSASSLIIAPRLPVQGITGCPIHLCWWPVFNEIVYHPGLRMYLLFQGKWLFVFPEGSPSHIPSLNAESVIDMAPFNLHFLIYAAYYDGHFKKLALIAKEGIANGVALFVDIQKRGTSWALKATSAQVTIRMVGTRQVDILSAEYIDPGEKSPKILWIAVKKKDTGQILVSRPILDFLEANAFF